MARDGDELEALGRENKRCLDKFQAQEAQVGLKIYGGEDGD